MKTKRDRDLGEKEQKIRTALQSGATVASGLWDSLQTDEALLIALMNGPAPSPTTPGNIEFGWVLYYLNNDAPWLLTDALQAIGMPGTSITTTMWNAWWTIFQGKGVVMGDGTWLDVAPYATMDPGWVEAFYNYFLVVLDITTIVAFPTTGTTFPVDATAYPTLTIAIMGDWGTGAYTDGGLSKSPSQLVAAQIANLKPDIVVHLGDVYYAGTSNEETANLLDCWPTAPLGNFTLNSNHEMYDGGQGYFGTTLNSPTFSVQKSSSYFAITYGDWVILGLDSAYNATGFYNDGAITDAYQSTFAGNNTAGNVIVLTHHNPMDVLGQSTNSLWSDVVAGCLNNTPPTAWYWGHLHNGVVYSSQAATGTTLGRCVGHGGIPYGDASWLGTAPYSANVDYYTDTPLGDSAPNNALRVKNGFAVLTISNGTLSEAFYDQDGVLAWSS